MPASSVGHEVEIPAAGGVGDRFERRLAGVANGPERQTVNNIGIIGRRLIQVRLCDAAAKRALSERQAVYDRRIGL